MVPKIEEGQCIRHFKGGLYFVKDIALDTETEEKVVLYQALYGNHGKFVRPLSMFSEKVPDDKKRENITGQIYRFEPFVSPSK